MYSILATSFNGFQIFIIQNFWETQHAVLKIKNEFLLNCLKQNKFQQCNHSPRKECISAFMF